MLTKLVPRRGLICVEPLTPKFDILPKVEHSKLMLVSEESCHSLNGPCGCIYSSKIVDGYCCYIYNHD